MTVEFDETGFTLNYVDNTVTGPTYWWAWTYEPRRWKRVLNFILRRPNLRQMRGVTDLRS